MMEKDSLGGFEDRPTAICPDCGNHYYGEMKYFSRCDGEGVIWHIVDTTSRRLEERSISSLDTKIRLADQERHAYRFKKRG